MATENTPKSEEVMAIEEAADGSAVVSLPNDIPSPQVAAHDDSDEADEAAAQAEIEANGSVDPDAEALRDAKRLKRRTRHKPRIHTPERPARPRPPVVRKRYKNRYSYQPQRPQLNHPENTF
jgi:hypothetical protein